MASDLPLVEDTIHVEEGENGPLRETDDSAQIVEETVVISKSIGKLEEKDSNIEEPVKISPDMIESPPGTTEVKKEANTELSDYTVCEDTGVPVLGEFHSQPVGDIARAAMKVVEIEGPIHYDELIRRIRTYWGLSRAGRRVQEVMKEAIKLGLMDGQIIQKGEFLYYKDAPVVVRRRTGNPPAKMNLISPEEISAAVRIILESQYATQTNELVREVSRLFGAKVTRGPAITRIKGVINDMIQKGEIEERPDGMVDFIRK